MLVDAFENIHSCIQLYLLSKLVVGGCYIAPLSALQQTHCALVACCLFHWSDCSFSQRVLNIQPSSVFTTRFELPPKWCVYSAIWLLHGWCQWNVLPSRHVLCTPHSHAPRHVTSCKRHTQGACVSAYNSMVCRVQHPDNIFFIFF